MKSVNIITANELVEIINVSGSGALNATLTAAAAVDLGNGLIRLPISADIFNAGSLVYIENTDAYDGIREVVSTATGYINIRSNFTAETFSTADTVTVAISPGHSFELIEVEIHMSAVPTTSEDFSVTKDAGLGANYDTQVRKIDFSDELTDPSWIWVPSGRLIYPDPDDKLRVAWNNSDAKTYGLTLKYRRI